MSLEKHINRLLRLEINQHLYISDNETGVYANKKWIDIAEKKVTLYYYEMPFDPEARRLPEHIKVKGMEFKIEYKKDQRPKLATEEELKELYEKVKKRKEQNVPYRPENNENTTV